MESKNTSIPINDSNANDYEKCFLEKYFRNEARKRIEKIEEEIKKMTDQNKIEEKNYEIEKINQELEINLKFVNKKKKIKHESVDKKKEDLKITDETYAYNNTEIPLYLWNYLFDYQKAGVKWMIDLYFKKKGGILADEMGLGKTIQAISMVAALFNSKHIRNVLIVCPATLVSHWVVEFERLTPKLKINKLKFDFKDGITVIGYEQYKIKRNKNKIDLLILDEGHKIKNKEADITIVMKSVKSESRFLLTGTPIQNNLGELWSLFDFVNPGLLGTYSSFYEEFEINIRNKKNRHISYKYSVMLRSIFEPYILRRLKSEIPHKLPGKCDKVVFVGLSEKQNELYIKALESDKIKNAILERKNLLVAIDCLRKICNHPFLIRDKRLSGIRSEEDENNFVEYDYIKNQGLIKYSSKIQVMMDFLKKWKIEGNRVLIFVQTVQMLQIIEKVLILKKYTYEMMSGRTPISKRKKLVSSFNNSKDGPFIFLLTTRVGGLGLNLIGANRIILFDPDWNPSTDKQAKERIYRYGQTSAVEIYRLISRDTIEEKIYQKQIYKDFLSKKILEDPHVEAMNDGLLDLFSFYGNNQEDVEVKDYLIQELKDDKLVDIKEEDRKEFSLMKKYNSKNVLSGSELIEYILRRELNLMYFD